MSDDLLIQTSSWGFWQVGTVGLFCYKKSALSIIAPVWDRVEEKYILLKQGIFEIHNFFRAVVNFQTLRRGNGAPDRKVESKRGSDHLRTSNYYVQQENDWFKLISF